MEYELSLIEDDLVSGDEDRYTKLKERFLIHATTEENLDRIKNDGLLPREMSGCYVWEDDRVPHGADVGLVLRCRYNHVYFWDDLYEGLSQAIATVGYLKEGNPGIVIVDASKIRDKLKLDPEIHPDKEVHPDEPTAYMYEGSIPPEDIVCTCRLDDEYKPDVGKLACPFMHEKEDCPEINTINVFESYTETHKWVCECDRNKLFEG